jgi:hypothetical protein
MKKNLWRTMAVVVPLAVVAACTDANKAPAEAAMAAAGTAMESLKGDAARYAPDAVKRLESSYSTAKDSMANKDYQGVLVFAKDIPAKAKDALATAAAAKAELAKAWSEAGDGVARMLETAKVRLDSLSRSKKLPAGVDRAALDKAQADLASIEAGWAAATEQYKAGDWSGAIARAKGLNAQGLELHRALGIQ